MAKRRRAPRIDRPALRFNASLVILWCLLFHTGLFDLWGENVYRRFLHHFQNGAHTTNKKPWIRFTEEGDGLNASEIKELHRIVQNTHKDDCLNNKSASLSRFFGGNYSRKCSFYYGDFSPEDQATLDRIGRRFIPKYERLVGKPVHLSNTNFRACVLRYEGEDAEFNFHYDTEARNCFRSLFLFHGEGDVSPFMYYDEAGVLQKRHLEPGSGLFFRGTTTYHGVGRSNDPAMKRYMVGFQYSTDNSLVDRSLCSELRSAPLSTCVLTLGPYLLGMSLCIYLWNRLFFVGLSPRFAFGLLAATVVLTQALRLRSVQVRWPRALGTRMGTPIVKLGLFLLMCLGSSLSSWTDGLLLFMYVILTEMLLPRRVVMDSLYRVGHSV